MAAERAPFVVPHGFWVNESHRRYEVTLVLADAVARTPEDFASAIGAKQLVDTTATIAPARGVTFAFDAKRQDFCLIQFSGKLITYGADGKPVYDEPYIRDVMQTLKVFKDIKEIKSISAFVKFEFLGEEIDTTSLWWARKQDDERVVMGSDGGLFMIFPTYVAASGFESVDKARNAMAKLMDTTLDALLVSVESTE